MDRSGRERPRLGGMLEVTVDGRLEVCVSDHCSYSEPSTAVCGIPHPKFQNFVTQAFNREEGDKK